MKGTKILNKKQKVGIIFLAFALVLAITVIVMMGLKNVLNINNPSEEPINENFSFLV